MRNLDFFPTFWLHVKCPSNTTLAICSLSFKRMEEAQEEGIHRTRLRTDLKLLPVFYFNDHFYVVPEMSTHIVSPLDLDMENSA